MPPNASAEPAFQLPIASFDGPLGRRIIETHIWAVRQGLRGATAYALFDGFCQRLVWSGVPLWRAHAALETLHPQWDGYGYIWRRDLNAIQPERYGRFGDDTDWLESPLFDLVRRARGGEDDPWMRRRFESDPESLDFSVFKSFAADGATDYFAQLFAFGEDGDRSHGSGIVYSFMTDRTGGFSDDEATLLHATLPALSLAMKADAGHVIASGLLGTYLGEDAGQRVHAGAVERGSVSSLRAVLWYADIRGFTPTSDAASGPVIVELLNDVFETMTAALRWRGGQVLKFVGDGMLATFAFEDADASETCLRALDAAAEAARDLAALNGPRATRGAPIVSVDIALHVGEVLYGNVGATDRLDFTVIGPAVNEVARIEALCEPLGRSILVSAEFVAAIHGGDSRLVSLGSHALRGVKRTKEVFGLNLSL
jgi:adenylate cyclase